MRFCLEDRNPIQRRYMSSQTTSSESAITAYEKKEYVLCKTKVNFLDSTPTTNRIRKYQLLPMPSSEHVATLRHQVLLLSNFLHRLLELIFYEASMNQRPPVLINMIIQLFCILRGE